MQTKLTVKILAVVGYTKNEVVKIFKFLIDKFKSKAVRYLYNSTYGSPKWSIRNDEQYIREGFEKLIWIYACVSMISSATSNIEWCLYKKINGEIEEIEEHPILGLVNNKVNDNMSSRDFFDLWATYLALNGKFYAVYDSPINPSSIDILLPFYCKPVPDLENFISSINYNISGDETSYSKNIMLWSKFNDPLDLYEGLSPIKAMARVIDTENSAIDWNKNSLDNSGVAPGLLSMLNPTPEQIEAAREKWKENYSGKKNVRTPIILNSEQAKYQSFGINQVEMDFILQRKINRIEICAGFGVPGQVVGDPEGQTYSNYKEAMGAFWKNTVIPKYLNHIKSNLNMSLVPKFTNSDGFYLDYNLDNIEVLQEDTTIKTTNVINLWTNDVITLNETRQQLGWGMFDTDKINGDVLKSQLSYSIVDNSDLEAENETDEGPEEETEENITNE